MYTRCPACLTVFRISSADLRAADGQVVCGRCDAQFNALASLSERPEEATVQPTPLSAPAEGPDPEPGTADLSQTGAEPLWDVVAKQATGLGPFGRGAGGNLDPVAVPEAGEGAWKSREPAAEDVPAPIEETSDPAEGSPDPAEEASVAADADHEPARVQEDAPPGVADAPADEPSSELPDEFAARADAASSPRDPDDVAPGPSTEDGAAPAGPDAGAATGENPVSDFPDQPDGERLVELQYDGREPLVADAVPSASEDAFPESETRGEPDPATAGRSSETGDDAAVADGRDEHDGAALTDEPAEGDLPGDDEAAFGEPFGDPTAAAIGDPEFAAPAAQDSEPTGADAGNHEISTEEDTAANPPADGEVHTSADDVEPADVDNVFTVEETDPEPLDVPAPDSGEDSADKDDADIHAPERPDEAPVSPPAAADENFTSADAATEPDAGGVAAYDDDGEITLPAGVTVDHDETLPGGDPVEETVDHDETLPGGDPVEEKDAPAAANESRDIGAEAEAEAEADESDSGDEADLEAALEAELNALADQAAEEWAVATGVREEPKIPASDDVDIDVHDEDAVDIELGDDQDIEELEVEAHDVQDHGVEDLEVEVSEDGDHEIPDDELTSAALIDDDRPEADTADSGREIGPLSEEPFATRPGSEAPAQELTVEDEVDDSDLEFDVPKDRWNEFWDSGEADDSTAAAIREAGESITLAAEDDTSVDSVSPAEVFADDGPREAASAASARPDGSDEEADDAWNMALPSPRPSDGTGDSVSPATASSDKEPAAPGHPLFEAPESPEPRRSRWWLAAAVLLGLALGMQWVHYNHASLLTHPRVGPILDSVYNMFGIAAEPSWELGSFRIIESAGVQDPANPGTLKLSVRFTNAARMPQPLPMLRVTLEDRWGEPVAMRDFAPGEYIASVNADQRLSPGIPTQGNVTIVDPGPTADGYRIDLCYPDGLDGAYCLGDLPGR